LKTEYAEGDFILNNRRYRRETQIVPFQGKEIVLENLTPILTPEQEQKVRGELEQRLYEVFYKYAASKQGQKQKNSE